MQRDLGQFPSVDGKVCVILPAYSPAGVFGLFSSDGFEIAQDTSPRWLSQSALESGALCVRWDFDLKIAEDCL